MLHNMATLNVKDKTGFSSTSLSQQEDGLVQVVGIYMYIDHPRSMQLLVSVRVFETVSAWHTEL